METVTAELCPGCGTPLREEDHLCRLCGHLFSRVERIVPERGEWTPPLESYAPEPLDGDRPDRILGIPEPWFFLLVGAAIAPVFALTPFVGLIGWFFGALVHEMGHCAAGWIVGRPAYPVLGLNGHAMSVGEGFVLPIALGILVAALVSALLLPRGPVRWAAMGSILLFYPLLVFTGLAELLTITGGHLGEMIIGGVFLYRTITGGFSSSRAERALYSVMGWFLVGANVLLTGGLVFSEAARREYAGNGSFGLMNDYRVMAERMLGISIESVAVVMTIPALLVVPIAIGASLLAGRRGDPRGERRDVSFRKERFKTGGSLDR
jgi:hypothetical protein